MVFFLFCKLTILTTMKTTYLCPFDISLSVYKFDAIVPIMNNSSFFWTISTLLISYFRMMFKTATHFLLFIIHILTLETLCYRTLELWVFLAIYVCLYINHRLNLDDTPSCLLAFYQSYLFSKTLIIYQRSSVDAVVCRDFKCFEAILAGLKFLSL